jgi:hypothetical protein
MNHTPARWFALVALVLGFVAGLAHAHHSAAMYDLSKKITLEGVVKELAWTNPHVELTIVANAANGQPTQTWTLETTSPGNLTRLGWNKRTFKAGDKVKVVVSPLRNGKPGAWFVSGVLLATGKEVQGGLPTVEPDDDDDHDHKAEPKK